jgi:hypothetical protein
MEYYVAVKLYCCHSIAYTTLPLQYKWVKHYVIIKFLSDLRRVGGFLRVFWFPPPIKLTARNNRNIVKNGVKQMIECVVIAIVIICYTYLCYRLGYNIHGGVERLFNNVWMGFRITRSYCNNPSYTPFLISPAKINI